MNDDNKDIVYLETRSEKMRGRWQAMSRVARMGIVSVVFGSISLIGCFLVSFIPVLSLPFALIGFLIGIVAFAAGFYQNLKRDGFWFPLVGSILSLLALAIGLGAYSNHSESQAQKKVEDRKAQDLQDQKQMVGRWLRGQDQKQESLEMTLAGSLLWKGSGSASEAETTVAKFQFKESSLVISFGDTGPELTHSIVRYNVDTSKQDKLLLSDRRVVSGNATIDMSGIWSKVGPPRMLSAAEKEIADFQSKLTRFKDREKKIDVLITKFESDREAMLQKLRPYEEGKQKDENWKVWARELNTLVDQIELLNDRKPRLSNASVLLEAAIGHLTRQAQMDDSGMDTSQLEDLLLTADKLDDELQSIEAREDVESFILQQTIDEELGKKKAADDPSQ